MYGVEILATGLLSSLKKVTLPVLPPLLHLQGVGQWLQLLMKQFRYLLEQSAVWAVCLLEFKTVYAGPKQES